MARAELEHIRRRLMFLLEGGQFATLDEVEEAMLRLLLVPQPGAPYRAVSLTLGRRVLPRRAERGDFAYGRERKPWGSVDIIFENAAFGLYRLNLTPGSTLPNHVHHHMRERELVDGHGLMGWRDDRPAALLPRGLEQRWRPRQPHGYENPTKDRVISLLCIDSPPFMPEDEVVVSRRGAEA
ncbi:MAG: hypothetical protein AAGA56_07570 [Myxococcota bacterium]